MERACTGAAADRMRVAHAAGSPGEGIRGETLDRHTLHWCEAVNASGLAHLTPALCDERWMVRISIGAEATEWSDVEALWDLMRQAATA